MSETVCVTAEQLRGIEWQYSGGCDRSGRYFYHCPACRNTAVGDGPRQHCIDCWLGNAIAQAERLKDWEPKVGDRVRLKAMPDGPIFRVSSLSPVLLDRVFLRECRPDDAWDNPAFWRCLAELMPVEG